MSNTWSQIIQAMIPVLCLLVTAGGAYLVALLRRETAKIEQQVDNEIATKYIEMANEAVVQATNYTTQVFVDLLKKQGLFDKEKQAEAFNMTKEKFFEIMSTTAIEALGEIYNDLDAWLTTAIENVVWESKQINNKIE